MQNSPSNLIPPVLCSHYTSLPTTSGYMPNLTQIPTIDREIMKRTFQKVYDNRESGNKIDKIFDELENEIAIDPDNKSDAVKRIVCILKEVSKASLPDLRMASVGALVRGLISVVLQVSLPFALLCTEDCVLMWSRASERV